MLRDNITGERIGKKQPIPYSEMKELLLDTYELRIKALIAVQYGTASRIGEIIPYTHHFSDGSVTETYGLLKPNIVEHSNYLEFILPVFKNPRRETKNCFISKKETFLIEPILEWLKICGTQVFDLREARARQLIREYTGYSSHYFRHSRAQHLVDIFDYTAYELKDALAHAALETSVAYIVASPRAKIRKIETRLEAGGL